MEPARKIVHFDDVKPNRSKKSRRSLWVGALTALTVAGVATWLLLRSGAPSMAVVQDFETALVRQGPLSVTSSASGTVVLPQTVSVTAPDTGYTAKLLVAEGDTVKEGQVLATLTVPDLDDTKADLQAQLQVARIALDDLANDWEYTLTTNRTSLGRLEAKVVEAQKDADDKKALSALKSSRQTDYEEALDTLEAAKEARDDMASQFANNLKKKDLALAKQRATINQLEISLASTLSDIEALRIKSPIAGEVLSLASELSVPQSPVTQNTVLAKVANRTSTAIDLEVNETDAGSLKVGDKLTVTVSTKTLTASVVSIGRVASLSSDGLTATVTVRVKPVEAVDLTPGASAAATISLGTKADALTLPRGAYLTTGGQKWVYVVEGNVARKTAVVFGTLLANTVEVKSGLKAGDTILTSSYQEFIDQTTVQLSAAQGEQL